MRLEPRGSVVTWIATAEPTLPVRVDSPPSQAGFRMSVAMGCDCQRGGSTPRSRQIFLARSLLISTCLGTCRGIADARSIRAASHGDLLFRVEIAGSGDGILTIESESLREGYRQAIDERVAGGLLTVDARHFLDPPDPLSAPKSHLSDGGGRHSFFGRVYLSRGFRDPIPRV